MNYPAIARGELWRRLTTTTQSALASGDLQCIDTEPTILRDGGIDFTVHVALNLERKKAEARKVARGEAPANPFLPPEPPLTLGALAPNHVAVLNKFNVVEHHLLIVTDHFAPQEALPDQDDFEALFRALAEYPSLGFYNGGTIAGASQGHKHLQLVPLPLSGGKHPLPISPLLEQWDGKSGQLGALPFRHRLVSLASATATERAARAHQGFLHCLEELGIEPRSESERLYQSSPYNLLCTNEWLMVVPRSEESVAGISINSLGFVGSLFVRNRDELAQVERIGPAEILRRVSGG